MSTPTDKHPTLYVVIETVPDAKPVVWHAFDSAGDATEYLAAPPGIEHGKVVQYVPAAALSSVTAERDALRAEITHIRDTSAAALLTALEAAEKRAANARREAFEEAARVADEVARRSTTVAGEGTARIIARDTRALAPEAKAEATPATVVVHRCNTDNGREVCTFEADHGGAHSWTPAFDARKFAEALVEGLSPPRGVAFHPEDPAVYHVRQAVMRAVALAAGSRP